MGANIVTQFLARQGSQALSQFNVHGAAVTALPLDLTIVNRNVNEPGLSRLLYGESIRKSLVERAEKLIDSGVQVSYTKADLQACQTIQDYENLVTCSTFGFKDAQDYYEKSSVYKLLDQIKVPQLVVNANDDPFFCGDVEHKNDPTQPVKVSYQPNGGHCGFIFHNHVGDVRAETTWVATELARFLQHSEQDRILSLTNKEIGDC